MNATNYSVMAAITIGCFGCGSALPKMDASRSIQNGGAFVGYMQDGKVIDPGDMADKLELEPKAVPYVKEARTLRVVSTILAAAGGAVLGWPLGEWASGQEKPYWPFAAAGGGVIAIAIPFAILSDLSMDTAVATHNGRRAHQKVLPAPHDANRAWKPGDAPRGQPVPAQATLPDDFGDAFGFVFGTSKTDAAAACQKAGHQWSNAEGISRCTGTPSTVISGASAELEFGEGRLSSVAIIIAPPNDATGWADMFRKTESALTQLYGKPMQRSFVVPDDCKAKELFLGCVAEGKVTGSGLWSLEKGNVATLSIVPHALLSASTLCVRMGRPRANP